jgi:hypothetical protein
MDNDFNKSTGFMKENKYSLPVYQAEGSVPQDFVTDAIPTTVIIDKTGQAIVRHQGGADYSDEQFISYLDSLAKK